MGFVHSPIRHILESAFVFCCFYGVVPAIDSSARAQESAIVAVDDSPAAVAGQDLALLIDDDRLG